MAKGASKPAKKRSGGLLIHVAILLLLAAIGWQLYHLQSQIASTQAEKDRTAQQVETLKQTNDALRADIAEGATEEKMKDRARDELGWTNPDEYVFIDKSN